MFSRRNTSCSKSPTLRYQARHASDSEFHRMSLSHIFSGAIMFYTIRLNQEGGITNSKYMFHTTKAENALNLIILRNEISFPYMLYEGHGCMYGGLYVTDTYLDVDYGVWSHCGESKISNFEMKLSVRNLSIVLIHYGGYSADRIILDIEFRLLYYWFILPVNAKDPRNETMTIRVPKRISHKMPKLFLESNVLKLRKIRHLYIKLDIDVNSQVQMRFDVNMIDYNESCVSCIL